LYRALQVPGEEQVESGAESVFRQHDQSGLFHRQTGPAPDRRPHVLLYALVPVAQQQFLGNPGPFLSIFEPHRNFWGTQVLFLSI